MHFILLGIAQTWLSKYNGRNQKATNIVPNSEKNKMIKQLGSELHIK